MAVKAVAAEVALRPGARTEAAGQLLATTVRGVNRGLHSRAGAMWDLLLRPDLLRLDAIKSARVGAHRGYGGGARLSSPLCII